VELEFSRVIFSCLEALIYLFTIHMILPKNHRMDWKRNMAFYGIVVIAALFFLRSSIFPYLLFHTLLIFSIFIINHINVYVASITIIISNVLILIASLISTVFAIYFYTDQLDYRFVLDGDNYKVMIVKVLITIACVYIYKIFNALFNRKIKIQKINPRPVLFVNAIYLVIIILMSSELIEYIPTIYLDVIEIESLNKLLFAGISMAYVASIFILYLINIYLFKSSDYLSIKLSSETDALTGVLNRKAGINFLKERMQHIQVKKGMLTVCFVDVNNLKDINDEYGHKLGDDLITNVACITKDALREGDEIARLGGDEFLVVFDQCSVEQAVRAWERIIEKFESFNITGRAVYDISVSVGFSEYNHKMNISHDTLIELADTEMYKNKERYKRLKGKKRNAKW